MSEGRIRLHYSNRSERLLDALAERIREERAQPGRSPLDPVTIVVPNRNVEAWLKFGLAERDGIAANLRTPFLRSWLGQVARAARPGTRMLDGTMLEGLLLELLHDDPLVAQPRLAPVARWLRAGTGDADDLDRRRCQLAERLARAFEEYVYSRSEMLRAWEEDRPVPFPGHEETEAWQRHLWRTLLARARSAGASLSPAEEWLPASTLFAGLGTDALAKALPRPVHVFGLSYMARVFLELFGRIALATELCIYTLNPCREFWEDVQTDREAERWKDRLVPRRTKAGLAALEEADPAEGAEEEGDPASSDPFGLLSPDDTPALVLWGRPGRENVRLLNELSDCDFDESFEDPLDGGGPTLLRALQHDILEREPKRKGPPVAPDRSLVVVAAPALPRECEAIASEIWKRVQESDAAGRRLRFNEIAVILPSARAAEYQAQLPAAFDELYGIPHHVVDLPASGESRIPEAAGLLLGLPFSRFTRPDVLAIATHPAVIGGFPEAAAGDWEEWTSRTAILHGADREDHAGTYIRRDLFSWDQGLRRLALGAFLPGRRAGESRRVVTEGGEYLPEEVPSDGLGSASSFDLLVRSLVSDARWLRGSRRTLAGWAELLASYLCTYVTPGSEEDDSLRRCLAAVTSLRDVPLGGRQVSYRVAFELASRRLGALPGARGTYLADGVVLSTFLPMRAIPFRHVFIAGLNEGDFPSGERRDVLDLRGARRRAGDVSPREQDRYMFLEALLSARESLTLSYVRRDALTGEALAPSSVVAELKQMLEPGVLDSFESLELRPPLRRWDPDPGAILPVEAARERQARAIRESLRAKVGAGVPVPPLSEVRAVLPPPDRALLDALLDVVEVPPRPASPPGEPERLELSLSQLRRFLECPLQGSAGVRLGLRESDEQDVADVEDEPFESAPLERATLLRLSFFNALRATRDSGLPSDAELEAARAEAARRLEDEGRLPTGLFGEAEGARDRKVLATLRDRLREACGGALPRTRVVRFGKAVEGAAAAEEVRPPLDLGEIPLPGDRRVRLLVHGETSPLVDTAGGTASLHVAARGGCGDEPAEREDKEALRGWIDGLALAASGAGADVGHRFLVARTDRGGNGGRADALEFPPFAPEEARGRLRTLAAEMLGRVHDYLLPCEAVSRYRRRGEGIDEAVESLVERERSTFSSDYGPVPAARSTYRPPSAAEAEAMVRARFDPAFAASWSRRTT